MSGIMKNIIKGDELGRGSFACVYLATDKRTGEQYALKELNDAVDARTVAETNKEAKLLRKLEHANIVK